MKKQTFLRGSLLLTGSALAAKVLGALFKIPLTAMLGGTGMGYFSAAYGLFLPLYAVFVTGLSTAVARPAAAYAARGNTAGAAYIRRTARRLFLWAGVIGTGAALLLAKPFTLGTTGGMEAYPAVLAMAPAVLLCCLTAVERGYYEGLCTMTPTAVSQAAEALAKLICGLALCRRMMTNPPAFLPEMPKEAAGALGAVLGVTLSAGAGYLVMLVRSLLQKQEPERGTPPAAREAVRMLLSVMIPAALGALVTNLTSLIDLATVMRLLGKLAEENAPAFYAGAHLDSAVPRGEAAAFVYGSFMGLAVTVFNLVPSLTNMLAKGVLPHAAQCWARGDKKGTADCARQVLLLTGLAAIPAGCGLFALSEGVLAFLFSGREAEVLTASESLRYLSPGVIFLCMAFPVFSLLQAAGRADLPVKVMLPGIAVKLAGNLLLVPRMYTAGAALSTTVSYGVILVLSAICLHRVLGESVGMLRLLLLQLWAGLMCAGTAYLCYSRLIPLLPQRGALVLAVGAGAFVYAALLLVSAGRELWSPKAGAPGCLE